jgi:hypothetical protein
VTISRLLEDNQARNMLLRDVNFAREAALAGSLFSLLHTVRFIPREEFLHPEDP